MGEHFKKTWWIVLFLLGGLFCWGLWSFKPQPCEARLKDGSTLRLECVRYKRKSASTPWQRWIEQGRNAIAQSLGRPVFNDTFAPPDSLVFWISLRDRD